MIIVGCGILKTRIISAIVMSTIVIPIIFIGGLPFKVMGVILAIASMYEIMRAREKISRIPLVIRLISYVLVAAFVYLGTDVYSVKYELIYKILIAVFLLYFIPVVIIDDTEKYSVTDSLYVLGATIFLGVAYNSFILISNNSTAYVVYLLLTTVVTDSFAYFTGYFIGKHKLCEKISPNKTIEGAVGGTITGTIIASLYYLYIINPDKNILLVLGITFVLSVVGQIGDLFFSSVKRHYNIKDFSNLIPGHGGILDRLDSIIFVVIIYILFMDIL